MQRPHSEIYADYTLSLEQPNSNKLVPAMYGMRSSMKGAAYMLPLREQFLHDIKDAYDRFIETCEDAASSLVAWELFDPCKVAASDEGSFANRGHHFNRYGIRI